MKRKHHLILSIPAIVTALLLLPLAASSCTIVSGIDASGHVWNANNEDGPRDIGTFINIFPRSDANRYGYYSLSYLSPEQGTGGNIQGGMNEAGLTFDFNAIRYIEDFDPNTREAFPEGDQAILPHILGNMSSVQEVIRFFETYWFRNGFRGAQMHVADSLGRFAIISASGIQLAEEGEFLVSTNFDICGGEDGSSCRRYPVATAMLENPGPALATMKEICSKTAQPGGGTLYSNVQNLTTGDIWFFSQFSPGDTVNINIQDLLAKGSRSYSFENLASLQKGDTEYEAADYSEVSLSNSQVSAYTGTYKNSFIGNAEVQMESDQLKVSFENGWSVELDPYSENGFFLPGEGISFRFLREDEGMTLKMYEQGMWSFTAKRE